MGTIARKRAPVSRGVFRSAGRSVPRRRPAAPPWVKILVAGAMTCAVLIVVGRGSSAVVAGFSSLGTDLQRALPRPAPTALVLPAVGAGAASADPIFDDLPSFTSQSQLTLVGRVPTFAIEGGRVIELSLNNDRLGRFAFDKDGRFGAALALRDGANTIVARLLGPQGDLVSQRSATVVLDRAAPSLSVTRPRANDSLDGPEIAVEGRTAARATVRVNGRQVAVDTNGLFADRIPVDAGAVTITVVARNEAGVETTSRIPVTVREGFAGAPGSVAVKVGLDASRVKPGTPVNATIVLSSAGRPVSGVSVSLSVGVIVIGTATTDTSGRASIGFAAPDTEGDIAVVVLAGGSSGRASLIVAK
ncbi:MAG: hypothetical protein FJ034_01275 [Chloroflexi bacterium]|nr:hypothetical protein [Chloroflexota bacterium]